MIYDFSFIHLTFRFYRPLSGWLIVYRFYVYTFHISIMFGLHFVSNSQIFSLYLYIIYEILVLHLKSFNRF